MPPNRILDIRHAEKPGEPGLDQISDGSDLSVKGFARAAALAFFLPEQFGPFDELFAAAESHHSNRPVETITPLSKQINRTINDNYANGDFQNLALELLSNYQGKTTFVCWHHGNIPNLAIALGVANPPNPWPPDVFDQVWNITFNGNTAALEIMPQRILFGDSAT